jgi:hypothetical protein
MANPLLTSFLEPGTIPGATGSSTENRSMESQATDPLFLRLIQELSLPELLAIMQGDLGSI